jgi:hypothetical protein
MKGFAETGSATAALAIVSISHPLIKERGSKSNAITNNNADKIIVFF